MFHSTSRPNVPAHRPGISPKSYRSTSGKLTLYSGATRLWALLGLLLLGSSAYAQSPSLICFAQSSDSSNFNNSSISAGTYLWFNAHLQVSGQTFNGLTVSFSNSTISIPGQNAIAVPNSTITFSSSATTTSAIFSGGSWQITSPVNPSSDHTFLTGVAWPVPSPGLAGGIQNVTWQGVLATGSASNVNLHWQWGAAVYTSWPTASGTPVYATSQAPGIKIAHQGDQNWSNNDAAGVPELNEAFVIAGGTGGGGGNFTGSFSGNQQVVPPCYNAGAVGPAGPAGPAGPTGATGPGQSGLLEPRV